MIYKFNRALKELEIELINSESDKIYSGEYISFSVRKIDCEWNEILLNKKEMYHLIGALHLLHKEMK
jgi:hypothetical protein